MSTPSADDFVIPDEETPISRQAPASAGPSASSAAAKSWVPSVDFSTAFTPFVTSKTFQQSNTISERRFAGGDTLDEPVADTLKRDLVQIGRRVAIVLWPAQLQQMAQIQKNRLVDMAANNGIRLPSSVAGGPRSVPEDDDELASPESVASLDWDLWGPLIFSLAYSVTMGIAAPASQTNVVFSGTFSLIWVFYWLVGLNIQLLGGSISFLSAISATGYSTFPIVLGSVLSTIFIKWAFVRLILMSVFFLWSIYAASMSLKCSGVLPGRVFLAIYPVVLMYAVFSWLVVIT